MAIEAASAHGDPGHFNSFLFHLNSIKSNAQQSLNNRPSLFPCEIINSSPTLCAMCPNLFCGNRWRVVVSNFFSLLLLLLLLSFSFATVVVFFIGCATIVLHSFFSGILLSNANLLFPPLPFRGLLLLLSPPLNITDPNVRIPSLSEDDDDVVVPVPVGGTSNRIPTCK